MRRDKSALIITLCALVVIAISALWIAWHQFAGRTAVNLGEGAFSVELVSSEAARHKGLSGRQALGINNGMLFVFPQDHEWGIWMKDMHFAIDIVWLGSDKKVVDYESNVTPQSYPKVFKPSAPARYVLELEAGAVERHNIYVGAQAHFDLLP